MSSGIFLINDSEEIIELNQSKFVSEDNFQKLVAKYPNLLAGDLINPEEPRNWLLIDREVGIPGEEDGSDRWSLDHLFIDQDGIPTLVEIKRSSDTRLRREVVGQLLDYAANAVTYWPLNRIIGLFESRCERENQDPTILIETLTDSDYDNFWEKVKTNLQAGKIRLIFLADNIPSELKRIVEFLNEQMDPAIVLALEIKQYTGEGIKTLVPSVYGNTSESIKRKKASYNRDHWTKEQFFKSLSDDYDIDTVSVADRIFEWSDENADKIWFGQGKNRGSFVPIKYSAEQKYQLFAVWTSAEVEIYFQYYQSKPPFDTKKNQLELLNKLNRLKGVNISESYLGRRPTIPFATLLKSNNLESFIEIFEWFLNEIN